MGHKRKISSLDDEGGRVCVVEEEKELKTEYDSAHNIKSISHPQFWHPLTGRGGAASALVCRVGGWCEMYSTYSRGNSNVKE